MKVNLAATYPHYLAHMAPIWDALPDDVRGTAYLNPTMLGTTADPTVARFVATHDVQPLREVRRAAGVLMAASIADARRGRGPVILTEHGIGQSYGGDSAASTNSAYAGGRGRSMVGLFLHPNRQAADRDAAMYPRAMVRVIGSPVMAHLRATIPPPNNDRPVVAIAGHWPAGVCHETLSAWGEFLGGFRELVADDRYDVIGHGHPRVIKSLIPHYRSMGVPVVESMEDMLTQADVVICDNSSVMYYAAGLGRGVVVLDSKWYRRGVNHGGRFWNWADIGPRITDPDALVAAVSTAVDKQPWPGAEAILAEVFPDVDDPISAAVSTVLAFIDAQVPSRNA